MILYLLFYNDPQITWSQSLKILDRFTILSLSASNVFSGIICYIYYSVTDLKDRSQLKLSCITGICKRPKNTWKINNNKKVFISTYFAYAQR